MVMPREYSNMPAVRGYKENFGQRVVDILGYKYPPVIEEDTLNTVQLLYCFDFRAVFVLVFSFLEFSPPFVRAVATSSSRRVSYTNSFGTHPQFVLDTTTWQQRRNQTPALRRPTLRLKPGLRTTTSSS
jgi:hypothetical protein